MSNKIKIMFFIKTNFILILFGVKLVYAQEICKSTYRLDLLNIDTLLNQLNKEQSINKKVETNNLLGAYYESISDYPKSLYYLQQANKLNNNLNLSINKIFTLNYLGYVYWHKSQYDSALFFHNQAVQVIKQNKFDCSETAFTYLLLGGDYYDLGDYKKTANYFFKSLKSYEVLNDTVGLILINNRLSKLYFKLNDYKVSKKHAVAAKTLNLNIKYNRELGASYNSLGNISIKLNLQDSALFYFNKTLYYYTLCGDKIGQAVASINLGDTYFSMYNTINTKTNLLDSAYYYYKKSYLLNQNVDNKFGIIYGYWGMADIDFCKGENYKALKNYKNALAKAIKINAKSEEYNLYWKINKVYEILNNKDSSYYFLKKYVELKNSIENDEQTKFLLRQESKYEIEKNISEQNAKMEQAKQLANEKNKQKNYIITGIILIILILIYIVFITIKRIKIIASKNEIINVINQELIVQKKEITDSINYARRIQEAILPSTNFFKECNLNNFVLYKPKDIVAGDFYWLEQKNEFVFLAVADCTGHGVPGAMVSVLCCNALNRAVLEFDITEPGKILDKTRELVLETFSKSDNNVKDGMDISLIAINKNTNAIAWAGANSPLWYVNQNGFFELKADKQPIGKTEFFTPFKTHQLFLKKEDLVYMTTDGYADQFGGEKGKKFKYKHLKETIIKNSCLSLENQKKELEQVFLTWKGNLEQVDDVCVLGIKI